ncbi:MAG: hypothetical protein Q7T82_19560 [Armatimonadota bacterium]|nr:hypothetical protein [Armatimonadota bacterium]
MSLEEWQERLERHFTQLAAARSKSGFPLFALEHGLTEDEFEEIGKLLRSRLADGLRLGPHWLVWVVYATELGYDYDGDEYWDSFEERTPQWRERGSRKVLRDWFSKFQATYHGVKPSGRWAGWFSIIAWPITHAILPKYLQRQFAKSLFDLRYHLSPLETLSPGAVGQLLAANAGEASSRFREFLQQAELAGRIVLALLSDRKVEGQSPIYPPTLQRLVANLEQVQSSREWLKETRRFVADRLKGAERDPGGASTGRDVQNPDGTNDAGVPWDVRPTLMLRRSGTSTWSVVINIPTFLGVARLHPELRTFLTSTRCKVAGAGETWLPTGWLLLPQRRVLKSWPGAHTPLVKFERSNGMLDQLIDSETRLSGGPNWLCRIGADGLAHEIVGRIVRPGRKYILLSEAALPSRHSLLDACGVDCDGLNAGVLSIPDTLSSDDIAWLQQLGLQVARTVRIWPAGLSGRSWDGEGHSEWLTTETPCFGISHDHPLDAYSVRLNGGAQTLIEAGRVGAPVFFKISPLPVGRHTLAVKARRGDHSVATPSSPAAEGVVTLEVREPEPWIPGTTSHAGLVISLDHHDPNLDTFWEGNVGVSILGPEGRHVTCAISLASASGTELLSEQIGTFDLPVAAGEWLRKFSRFVKDEGRAWTYLEAASGRFSIRGDELGEYSLRLEREVKPVRWVCRSIHRVTTVRLIDDTGRDDAATATYRFFGFRRPALPTRLPAETVLAGFQMQPPGGLIEASHGDFLDTIIVSTPQIEGGLQSLDIEPDLHELDSGNIQVRHVLDLLRLWSEARLVGPLVGIRRNRVLGRLINLLYSRLCGRKWAEAEAAYLSDPQSLSALQQLERSVGGSQAFPVILLRGHDRMEAGTGPGTEWYAEVAAEYKICSEKDLCEFALRLASQPHKSLLLPEAKFDGLLHQIGQKPALLRGARLLALLAASQNHAFDGGAFPRWKW